MVKIRDGRFDTLKGFLILSVVLGHFFIYDTTHSFMSESFANFFYAFHMPLFVFVSGFFTNSQRLIGGGQILETYILYQLFKGIWLGYSLSGILCFPTPMLWYLFALIIWRIINYVIRKNDLCVSWKIVALFFSLSVIVGFIPWIGHKFALSRFVFFAPYFFLGVICQRIQIVDVIKRKVNRRISIAILMASLIVSMYFAYNKLPVREIFYGSNPFPVDNQMGYMLARIGTYPISLSLSLAFIRLFSFENGLLGRIGMDSLKFYMFHGVVIMVMATFEIPWSFLFAVLYAVVTTVILYIFNQMTLSDFAIAPVCYITKRYKHNYRLKLSQYKD